MLMVDVFSSALALLGETLKANAGVSATYVRGAQSVPVTVWLGNTAFDQVIDGAIAQRVESLDVLMVAADLILSGEVTLPERGDRILITRGTKTFEYEVMPIGPESQYRADPQAKNLRIHTKLSGVLNG